MWIENRRTEKLPLVMTLFSHNLAILLHLIWKEA